MSKTDARPTTIVADNLSLGWAEVMLELTRPGVARITPLSLVIRGFDGSGVAAEVPEIRRAVDAFLMAQGKRDTENVAWTVFPQRYWELSGGDRESFFQLFTESFVRVQHFSPKHNRRGSYFQRLVDLRGEGRGPNQLKWILDEYDEHPRARRTSKFQATTFDPSRDHSSTSLLEFPCLQQVSVTFDDGALHLNAFYATQQIARKAYGNYLGLSRLGAFMANEMKLAFEQMNIFVGLAQMDAPKSCPDVTALLDVIKKHVNRDRAVMFRAS